AGPDADDVVVGVDVDAGRVRVLHLQGGCVLAVDGLRSGLTGLGLQLATGHGDGHLEKGDGGRKAVRGRGPRGKQSPERGQPREGSRGVTSASGTTSRVRLINGHEAPG